MTRRISAIVGLVLSVVGLGLAFQPATGNDNPGVCSGTHLFPIGESPTLTYTADEGYLVSGYCVKAGSANQGNGPEYVTVDPPQASVVISHSSGKDISHYTVTLVKITTTETPTPTPTPTVTITPTPTPTVTPTETVTPTPPTLTPTETPSVVLIPPVESEKPSPKPEKSPVATQVPTNIPTAVDAGLSGRTLPNTGGPNEILVLIGMGLLLLGTAAIAVSMGGRARGSHEN